MQRLLHILLLLLSLSGAVNVFAQETEVQLKEKADKLFDKQDYVAATTAFLQLLALQPRNPEYNYKYGTCLLYNSRKKSDAIKYLEFATASGTVDIQAFFYMGKAYHLNYQFEEALKFYNLYKANSRGKPNKELEVERQIEMCENGKKLLKKITDIIVLKKDEYMSSKFFELYDLTGFGGNILVGTTHQSKLDKKKGFTPTIHFPPNAKKIYFASYGDNEENGKQIYVRKKLAEGGWSAPELVKGEINTKYDEDFPYLDPSGEYLYFSSEGHNSMGGFDVFKSKYDEETNSFGLPENVDFAISSADDDLFYIVDSLDQNAWFASSRQSQDGKFYVYNVRVERLASPIAAIKGTFASTVHPDNKKFNIEVKDLASGRQIGTFYSQNDGSYLIALPKGGKYEYAIKITGSPQVFKAIVNVPVLNEFKPLKQQILHGEADSKEIVKVIDLFDQDVENADGIMAEIVQLRSELNVNAAQFDLKSLDNPAGKEVFAELGLQKLSPLEAKDKVLELAKSQTSQVKILEEVQQKAIGKIVENAAEIKALQADFKNKAGETNATSDPQEKYELYLEAEKKATEITVLEQENQELLRYSDSVAKVIQSGSAQVTAAKKIEQQLAQVSEDAQIIKVIGDNKAQIKSMKEEGNSLPSDKLVQEILKLKNERDQLNNSRNSYQASANQAQNEIQALENKLTAAKSKDKPSIQNSIDLKKNELEMINQQIKSLDQKIEKITVPLDQKEDQLEYLQNIQREKLPAKTLAGADAKKAIESTENQNYKTLKSYVTQQKAELEKNAAIAGKENDPVSSETPETQVILEKISPEHEEKLTQIANDPKLTEEERLQRAQAEDNTLKNKVEKEIERVEKTAKQNPSDVKTQAELKSLQSIQKEVNARMDQRSTEIEAGTNSVPEEAVSAETIMKEIKPDLDKRLDEIANDPNLSVIEQLKMAQNEELEFEQIISEEIGQLEIQIDKNPSDQTAKNQLKSLQAIKKQVTENIDNRSLAIESLDPGNEVKVEKPSKFEVLTSLKPGHEDQIAAIDSNPDLSATEKLQQSQKEDENLLSAANAAIKRVEAVLKKNPNDSETQAEYETLLEIREETNLRVSERKAELEKPEVAVVQENGNPENENPENVPSGEIISRLKPGHEQKIASIANDDLLSPQEKQTKLIQEEAKLQKAIDAEIKKMDKILAKNPADEKALAEKAALATSKEASETRADESNQLLIAEEKTAIKPADLLFKTDKNYQLEIQKIENGESPDKNAQLIVREKSSQQILRDRIRNNEVQLAKKENPALAAENQVLNELIDASEKRVETLGGSISETDPVAINSAPTLDIVQVRNAKLGENASALTDDFNAPEDLKKQSQALKTYQSELKKLIDENKKVLSKNPADENLLAEKSLYAAEQKTVETKLKEVEKQLEDPVAELKNPEVVTPEAGNPVIAETTQNPSEFSDHPDVRELQKEKTALQEKLADPAVSERERQSLQKEIAATELKQVKVENSLKEEKIKDESADVSAEIKSVQGLVSTNEEAKTKELAAISSIQKSEENIAAQLKALKSEKNPVAKQEILNQVLIRQIENQDKLNEIKVDQALNKSVQKMQESDPSMTIYKMESTKDLESRRRRGIIEIGELTSEIERLNAEIKSTSKSAAKVLVAERDAKAAELATLEAEQSQVANELAKRSEKPLAVYNESAINENITYEEERKIASSEPYKKYAQTAQEAALIQKSIAQRETELEALKGANHLQIVASTGSATNSTGFATESTRAATNLGSSASPDENLSKIVSLTKEIEAEKAQLSVKKQETDQIINESEDAMKLQNLIARGVEPIKLALASALIPLPSNGFEIVSNPRSAPVKVNIPVDVDVPSGLVYRVQVGAFAKPVKEELFKEFNPVSGEKLTSGITRYMAGYFNNRAAVMNARQEIQDLGYADAFPVAYCDGQRISMQEARRLEESGQCVALGVETLIQQASENVAQVNPNPADTNRRVLPPVDNPGAYNQAPGAAKAIAVETRQGLLFTVQIGVYNKPVPASQIKNMEPLITKRLANGQIRYSAGIFQSVETAQPKKREAIARGISDAYITAYYKGERISLDEARKLLAELGTGILEKENPKENKVVAEEKIKQIEKETQKAVARVEQEESMEEGYNEDQIQFVSKKSYDAFPRDLLKRFNENGSFFYDANDQKIKSIVYKNQDYVPQVYYFRNEIDTVFLSKSDSLHEEGTFQVLARITAPELTGEIGEWLIRLGYQREIRQVEGDKIQVRIFGIRDEATFDEVIRKMRSLGFDVLSAG